jgi:hypothetical protein
MIEEWTKYTPYGNPIIFNPKSFFSIVVRNQVKDSAYRQLQTEQPSGIESMAEKHREKRGMDNDCREQRAFEKSQ